MTEKENPIPTTARPEGEAFGAVPGANADMETAGDASRETAPGAGSRRFSMLQVNLLFIGIALLLLTLGTYFQGRDVISGLLITEFGLLLGVCLLVMKWKKIPIRETLRLNPVKPMMMLKVFFSSLCLIPVAMFLNVLAMTVIAKTGRLVTPELPEAAEPVGLLLMIFVIAVSAGICEEVLFRGVMLRTYERELGRRWGAVLTALLFGVFHFNLGNLLGPIMLGLAFAYYVQLTDSLWPAIWGHFLNNGIAVVISYIASKNADELLGALEPGSYLPDELAAMTIWQVLIPFALPALTGGVAAFFILRSMKNQYPRRASELYDEQIDERYDYSSTQYRLWGRQPARVTAGLVVPLTVIAVAYVAIGYLVFFRGA